jgi:hypothetical protein
MRQRVPFFFSGTTCTSNRDQVYIDKNINLNVSTQQRTQHPHLHTPANLYDFQPNVTPGKKAMSIFPMKMNTDDHSYPCQLTPVTHSHTALQIGIQYTALSMTDLIQKAKKSKSTDEVVKPESTEDQPIDGGKSDRLLIALPC